MRGLCYLGGSWETPNGKQEKMANLSGDFYLKGQAVKLTKFDDFATIQFGEFGTGLVTLYLSPEQIQAIGKQILSKVGLVHGA
jgi:hypothetical protein